eukprot:687332-Hanusia_phi.AAC.2
MERVTGPTPTPSILVKLSPGDVKADPNARISPAACSHSTPPHGLQLILSGDVSDFLSTTGGGQCLPREANEHHVEGYLQWPPPPQKPPSTTYPRECRPPDR